MWKSRYDFLVEFTRRGVPLPIETTSRTGPPRDRFQDLVEEAGYLIFALDVDLRFTYISPSIRSFLGHEPEEVEGHLLPDFVLETDGPYLFHALRKALKADSGPLEFRIMMKDGGLRHVRASVRPFAKGGAQAGLTGIMSDITSWVEAERAFRLTQVELEKQAEERTRDLMFSRFKLGKEIQERQQSEKVQTCMFRIAEAALACAELDPLLDQLPALLGEILGFRTFHVALGEPGGERLGRYFSVQMAEPLPAIEQLGPILMDHVFRTRQTLLLTPDLMDELAMELQIRWPAGPGLEWLGVPLASRGPVLGVLALEGMTGSGHFLERDRAMLQFTATQVSMVLDRLEPDPRPPLPEAPARAPQPAEPGGKVLPSLPGDRAKSPLKPTQDTLAGLRSRYSFEDILTRNPAVMEIKALAALKARSEASVLIIGETGTGKELFAHAIHGASFRRQQPFLAINCAALPESLLESELFGYREGAFTGALKGGKPGLFELAHGGTLFLDEIGELNLGFQTRLLRVLESGEVMRVGGDRVIQVDTRIIAATNRDLWRRVEEGTFRKDLFFRLNVLPINIPPLRERREDILLILEQALKARTSSPSFTTEALERLSDYPWPGNIRELKNLVEYLRHLETSEIGIRELLPFLKVSAGPSGARAVAPAPAFGPGEREPMRFILQCLHAGYQQREHLGRKALMEQARAKGVFLTEAQIRAALGRLDELGLVRVGRGRGGTRITPAGIEALVEMP